MLQCHSFSTTSRHFWILDRHLARTILRSLIQLSRVWVRTAVGYLLIRFFVYLQNRGRRNEADVLESSSELGNGISNLLCQPSYLLTFSPSTTKWMNLMHVSNSNGTSGTAVYWHSSRRGSSRRSPIRQLHRRDSAYTIRPEQLIQASTGAEGSVLWLTFYGLRI